MAISEKISLFQLGDDKKFEDHLNFTDNNETKSPARRDEGKSHRKYIVACLVCFIACVTKVISLIASQVNVTIFILKDSFCQSLPHPSLHEILIAYDVC